MSFKIPQLISLILCFFLASPVLADQSSKQQKLLELMNLLGIEEVFKDYEQSCLKQADSYQPEYIYEQQPDYFGGIKPNDPTWSAIVGAYNKYAKIYCSCISEKEYIGLHAKLYGEYVSENEIDAILKFLRSPIGQKDIHAGLMARKRADEYISDKIIAAEKKAYNDYMTELESIISQHQNK